MLNNFVGKDIINIGDMTPDQFQYLLDLSKMLKAEKMTGVDHARFHNKNVVAHFEWESTRTRCAFETSCHDLGLGFTYLSNSHFGNKETVKDSIRVFSEMYDAIVLRAQREEAYVREVADIATIPVINACCEGDHPTQMLADALTMQELLGNLKGRKLAFVGNCATTAMWYGRLCALLGMDFYAVGPDDERYQLCDSFKENIEDLFNKWAPNNEIVLTSDKEKLKGMDVVTTECWIYQNPDVHDEEPGRHRRLDELGVLLRRVAAPLRHHGALPRDERPDGRLREEPRLPGHAYAAGLPQRRHEADAEVPGRGQERARPPHPHRGHLHLRRVLREARQRDLPRGRQPPAHHQGLPGRCSGHLVVDSPRAGGLRGCPPFP